MRDNHVVGCVEKNSIEIYGKRGQYLPETQVIIIDQSNLDGVFTGHVYDL